MPILTFSPAFDVLCAAEDDAEVVVELPLVAEAELDVWPVGVAAEDFDDAVDDDEDEVLVIDTVVDEASGGMLINRARVAF